MQIQIFNIPTTDSGRSLVELNNFLSTHKILEIEQKFFQNCNGGCWSFCVRYLPTVSLPPKDKIDYKQLLTETEFLVFSKLREIRKKIATIDAVPAYAVFTDEELANIVKLPTIDVKSLTTIKGIGEKKVEKYGHQLIELFQKA